MPDTRNDLLTLLAARPDLSQSDLAERLGVSARTVRRHVKELLEEGRVIQDRAGRECRYRLSSRALAAMRLPELSEGEVETLSVAVLAARPLLAPTPLAGSLRRLASALRTHAMAEVVCFEPETDALNWSFEGASGSISVDLDPEIFYTVLAAARNRQAVRADYYTASRQELGEGRRLGPLGLFVRGGSWMAACLDLDAEPDVDGSLPVKDFALAGFRAAEPIAGRFVAAPDGWSLAGSLRDRFGALDGEPELVRLLVEPEAVPYFERKLYNPTQQVEQVRPDGRAVVSFEVGGMEAVKAWVLSWGAKVRVLTPESLAEAVASTHQKANDMYIDD